MLVFSNYWFAAAVKPRHEKCVQKILEYEGFRTSLPLRKCGHIRRCGSKWESEKPLIPGYVFVADDPENTFRVLAAPGVTQIVGYRSGTSSIPATQIEALERIAASQLLVTERNYIQAGDTVHLIGGPLKGVQGLVLREAGTMRFVVSLELLQRSVTVEIESDWACPVPFSEPLAKNRYC